ncbi:MAG: ATP-binding cassette domain-containing protein, partial [Solirubrobacteraceae bacterium]
VRNVSKRFGAVRALSGVTLAIDAGEVLGLVGDNGAGKSTLVRCIGGIHRIDEGAIRVDGVESGELDPERARELGIEIVHQHLSLVEQFDVAQNMFLNRELMRSGAAARWLGWLHKRAMYDRTSETLASLDIRIDGRARVATLSGGQRQIVAVARAVTWGSHIVVLDEPAAALGVRQAEMVLNFVRMLAGRGVAVVFITHNMEHVLRVTDRVAVLRQGRKVADMPTRGVSTQEIVAFITGADGPAAPRAGAPGG